LNESVDRALDHDEMPMADWDFIFTYITSERSAKILRFIKSLPLIGYFTKRQLFSQFSFSYDVIVNFLEGHAHALLIMQQNYGD